MLFNSYSFLFLFLPVVLIGAFGLSKHIGRTGAMVWVALASIVFYGLWSWAYVPLLLGSVLANYLIASRLGRSRFQKSLLIFGIVFNLGLLGYFKYADFFLNQLNGLFGSGYSSLEIILPIGISFFTFQQIAFLVDKSKNEAHVSSPWHYLFFVGFFPQLIAGPIVHHKEIMPQLLRSTAFLFQSETFGRGCLLFCLGLGKKVLVADTFAQWASPVFQLADQGGNPGLIESWIATIAFSLQIYFDFSAYSDMAIGLAFMLGLSLPVNFNSPYRATSIIDFWKRWHMTLSRFLRDYLYIPLGGNKNNRSLNILIVMTLGGLWHGANWTFVMWGLLHGIFIVLNHFWRKLGLRVPHILGLFMTFLLVSLCWIFFRAETFDGAFALIEGLIWQNGFGIPVVWQDELKSLVFLSFSETALTPDQIKWAVLSLPFAMICVWTLPNSMTLATQPLQSRTHQAYSAVVSLLILCACLWQLDGPSEFIYFQF